MSLLARLLSLPFTLLSLILSRLFRFRPYSRLTSSSSTDNDDEVIIDPQASSEYFVRSLNTHSDTSEAVDSRLWFIQGGYNSALRKAKEEAKILVVVLTSKEHDDHSQFMRHTLCTPAFSQLIRDHSDSIVLWGGEVCISRDAHIASTILQSTTFPFLAFLSVQPLPPSRITGSSLSASSNKMSVFSRLEGLSQTSLPAIISHLQDIVLPRLSPFLERTRAQKRERESERRLREEQDRAYEEAGKRDYERVKAKEAELLAYQQAEKDRLKAEKLRARKDHNELAWRLNKAREISATSEPSQDDSEATRLVIRLSDGRRLIRRFAYSEKAERIWEYIDCEAAGIKIPYTQNTTASPDIEYVHPLAFSLATTFPRNVITLDDSTRTKTVGQLVEEGLLDKQTANVIVEGLAVRKLGEQPDTDEEDEEDEED